MASKIKGSTTIDVLVCKGCGLCVHICPRHVLELDTSIINQKGYNPAVSVRLQECNGCAMCGRICPESAIRVERE